MKIILKTVEISQGGILLLKYKCPFCKKDHQHGGGNLSHYKPNPRRWLCSFSFGDRISHCIKRPDVHISELLYYPSITNLKNFPNIINGSN